MKATLILENGQTFAGTSIGSAEDRICEMVFNTSMVGYQEILRPVLCRTGRRYDLSADWQLWRKPGG